MLIQVCVLIAFQFMKLLYRANLAIVGTPLQKKFEVSLKLVYKLLISSISDLGGSSELVLIYNILLPHS